MNHVAALTVHGYADTSKDVFVSSLAKLIDTFAAIDHVPDWETLLKPTYAEGDPTPEPSSILHRRGHILPTTDSVYRNCLPVIRRNGSANHR